MGILQTRILVWIAMSSSRGSFQLRDWTQVSRIAGEFFTVWAAREAQLLDTEFIVQRIHSFLQEQELFLWSDVSFFQPLAYSFGRLLSSGDWLKKLFKLDPLDQASSLRLARKGLEAVYIELLCCKLFELLKIVFKSFCTRKEAISKVKRQPSELEKIIANKATDKEVVSKYTNNSCSSIPEK